MKRRLSLVLGLALAIAAAAPAAGATLPEQIDLPNGWAPEGITAGRHSTVFVGSLAGHGIWKGDVTTGTGAALPGTAGAMIVGLDYDARNDRIWAAGGDSGEVRVYDATSGALLQAYTFSPAGFLNDVAVTDHAVYVTDSMVQQLDVIPLGDKGALPDPADIRTLPLSGDISFVENEFNANGIVASPGWLIVVQSNAGKLFRVSRSTGVAEEIDLGGASVTFGDGLERHGRTLYVVRNQLNQVDVFRLAADSSSGTLLGTLTSTELAIPTTAAHTRGHLWAVNAQFGVTPGPDVPYWITRLPARP
jgi:hypothetical protein